MAISCSRPRSFHSTALCTALFRIFKTALLWKGGFFLFLSCVALGLEVKWLLPADKAK